MAIKTKTKKLTHVQKVQQVLTNIGKVGKPSSIGVPLNIHNYTGETACKKRITQLLQWYEPKSVLRKVHALNLYWATLNQKLAQNLYAYTVSIIQQSNYEQNIVKEQQRIERQQLLNLQTAMNG